jgi:asparagine synthetase B (glutamine-hydrolysing)
LKHVTIDSREMQDNREIADQLVELYGSPNDNMSGLSVRQMSGLARKYVKVALSGSGGDELAFGYNKYAFFLEASRFVQNTRIDLWCTETSGFSFRRLSALVAGGRLSEGRQSVSFHSGQERWIERSGRAAGRRAATSRARFRRTRI